MRGNYIVSFAFRNSNRRTYGVVNIENSKQGEFDTKTITDMEAFVRGCFGGSSFGDVKIENTYIDTSNTNTKRIPSQQTWKTALYCRSYSVVGENNMPLFGEKNGVFYGEGVGTPVNMLIETMRQNGVMLGQTGDYGNFELASFVSEIVI